MGPDQRAADGGVSAGSNEAFACARYPPTGDGGYPNGDGAYLKNTD
jgi:hypothetical protein